MASALPISAVILCRNEAANLPRCIAALEGCAEVLVIDDGSIDGSREVAAQAGARVLSHAFTSFADQRNWAMDHGGLSSDWVLHLDADEVMTPAGLAELAARLSALELTQVGFLPRKMMLDETWLRYSADYPVYVPRVVHQSGPRFTMRGHGETMELADSARVFFHEPMLHYNFSKGWPDWWQRHERYARAEAQRIRAGLPKLSLTALAGGDRSARRAALRGLSYRLPGRPLLRFAYMYLLRLGFLDGRPGLRYCRAMATYEAMINRELSALRREGA